MDRKSLCWGHAHVAAGVLSVDLAKCVDTPCKATLWLQSASYHTGLVSGSGGLSVQDTGH